MSNLSKTYHGQSLVLFQILLTMILHVSQQTFFLIDFFFKMQRNKLNTNKSKKLAFLSQQFHCNKKTSCSVSGGGGSVSVIISTDIGVDNAADSNITELTNNLDSKKFSCISDLEDQILFQKKMLSNFLLQLS